MSNVLLTGAAGNLGKVLRNKLAGQYDLLRLSDLGEMDPAGPGEETVQCDLGDAGAVMQLAKGMDAIIHLGGMSVENTFEVILNANIRGTYNIYEAARKNGVGRVIFASSNHAIGFHEREKRLDADAPLRPDSLYGVSKGFGEILAQYYFDKFGIETVSIRIGSSFAEPANRRMLATWLSFDDLASLVRRAIAADRVGCTVVYGASDNPEQWWDNSKAAFLGWQPRDSSAQFADDPKFRDEVNDPSDPAVRYQGGGFAAAGHFED
ncbi:NAD-dependent epimerase/dehydratase family protein [Seohaeicola saemankumensis]|nr:NAD(P)-dependent oxidoreductase [Seohaeicola saemankumensis]MCA0872986.1 NAD-dependent epimerase/dehydratase family protein [Seohaeicola saemankumensis]